MKRVIIAGVIAGFVVTVWGGVSWSLLPYQTGKIRSMPNEAVVADLLAETLPGPGVYQYPGDPDPALGAKGVDEAMEKYLRGPYIPLLVYVPGPGDTNFLPAALRAVGTNVAAGLLAALLMAIAAPTLSGYWYRVAFVALVAVFAVLVTHAPYWAWGTFPARYTLIVACDAVIGWFFAGLVLARLSTASPA